MKFRLVAFVAGCVLATASFAADRVDVEALAKQADLSARQVRMVLGAPVAFAEYRTSYPIARNKLARVVGRDVLRDLSARYREQVEQAASLAGN